MGGRLFLADGLVDISYGPTDVVLLDGNIPHGITTLRDFPGQGGVSRPELERFTQSLYFPHLHVRTSRPQAITLACGLIG